MTCGIYKLTCPSGQYYIGSSRNIEIRIKTHLIKLRKLTHYNKVLERAWKKHCIVVGSVVLICRPQDLLLYEQLAIDALYPAYNCSKIAGRVEMTDEIKLRISSKLLGRYVSLETKEKMSQAHKGNKQSSETKAKIAKSLRKKI